MDSSKPPLFTGSCFCKAITLRIYALPQNSRICHCQECRRATGSSFAHNVVFHAQSVILHVSSQKHEIVRATTSTSIHEDPTAISNPETMKEGPSLKTFGDPEGWMTKFCSKCAGRVLLICGIINPAMADYVIVPVGMIDDGESDARLAPSAEYWCKRREPWMPAVNGTEDYDTR